MVTLPESDATHGVGSVARRLVGLSVSHRSPLLVESFVRLVSKKGQQMTQSFTDPQRAAVDKILDILEHQAIATIQQQASMIALLDRRPEGVYDPTDPTDHPDRYYFQYVQQGMLEDLIERLQGCV